MASSSSSGEEERGVRILCLDGGGMRGLVSIELLAYVSKKLYNDPSGRKLFEQFDLICGTSTGGILAIGLCQGFTLEDAKKFYLELGLQLFSSSGISKYTNILRFSWERAFYSADAMQSMLTKYLGTVQMTNVMGSLPNGSGTGDATNKVPLTASDSLTASFEKILVDSGSTASLSTTVSTTTTTTITTTTSFSSTTPSTSTPTSATPSSSYKDKKAFVVSTNITKTFWKPYLFRTYDLSELKKTPNKGTCKATNIQALRATSAAPTYFKAEQVNDSVFADGGLTANNPSEIAVTEAKTLWPNRKIDLILSVGTGKPKNSLGSENLLPLFNEIVDVTTNSSLIHHRLRSWVAITLSKSEGTKLVRLNPRELGSIPLNESRLPVLEDMMKKTIEYIEKQTGKVESIAKALGVELPPAPAPEQPEQPQTSA